MSRRSFQAAQSGMQAAGQNVANADTPGYTRRRVTLQADATRSGLYMQTAPGTITSNGVSVQAYSRVRDGLLAASSWEAQTGLGAATEEKRLLGAMEGLFPADGNGSLGEAMSRFWNGWSNLADYPADNGARIALRSSASTLASTLNRLERDLTGLEQETNEALSTGVEEVNELLNGIAELNATIQTAAAQGVPDLAAEDRRDELVKELSAFAPVRAQQDGSSGYTISIDGITVIQGDQAQMLEIDDTAQIPQVLFGNTGVAMRSREAGDDGKLGAWLRTLGETFPQTRTSLDEMAQALVTEVNAIHQGGYGLDGATGRDFFDPGGVTAGSIRLSDDVLGDPKAIAAAGEAGVTADNAVARDLADLRNQKVLGGGTETVETFAIHLTSGIGGKVQRAATQVAAQGAVADHLDAMERSISGVSLDEEMTNLIQHQQSFAASARVLSTAESMIDTLLAL